jgi:hypothetical protein
VNLPQYCGANLRAIFIRDRNLLGHDAVNRGQSGGCKDEVSVMMTGHQCVSGATASRGCDLDLGSNAGLKDEGKTRMTPADFIYRIATLTAVIFLLATVL